MTGLEYKEKILQDDLPLHIREFENNSGGQIPTVMEDNASVCREVLAALIAYFIHTQHNLRI